MRLVLLRVLAIIGVCAAVLASASSLPAAAQDTQYGVGGTTSFAEDSHVAVPAGGSMPRVQWVIIQNTGTGPADINFDGSADKPGVKVNPDADKFTLQPNEFRKVFFGVQVDPGAVPQDGVRVSLQGRQTNVPKGSGDITFTPAFGGTFFVDIVGATAHASVKAVNSQDNTPVDGDLSIEYIPPQGDHFVVAAGAGNSLEADIAPGNYKATLDIPGLVTKSENFQIAAGETKEVIIKLEAINFVAVGVKPKGDSGVQSADLVSAVRNSLKTQEGPFSFKVRVMRDGTQIDDLVMQTQPSLPNGITEVRLNYTPTEGWHAGDYVFEFYLQSPDFTITASEKPTLNIPRSFLLYIIVAAVIIIVLLLLFFLWRALAGRRGPKPRIEAEATVALHKSGQRFIKVSAMTYNMEARQQVIAQIKQPDGTWSNISVGTIESGGKVSFPLQQPTAATTIGEAGGIYEVRVAGQYVDKKNTSHDLYSPNVLVNAEPIEGDEAPVEPVTPTE